MKKTLIASAAFIISTSVYAESATSTTTVTTTTALPNQPVTSTTTSETTKVVQPIVIDCHYRIPANTTVPQDVVTTWAEKATTQSFDYNSENIDLKLQELKACFTDQGWKGYNDALTQSGNLTAIKKQNLTVSSQVDGKSSLSVVKDNQWKLSIPLQVVYQNDKEKLTQLLSIDLFVTRKMSGDLGIEQIIATPRDKAQIKTGG
ncbi:MAG: DotI/IcmL family type IV secretion protein [Legionellaceae bacterium]|nr:DotI/IcmL family type IV secretion protein [Legionellaceae bacterium]